MVTTAVSLDAYLNGPVPDPDVEYVDGALKEKSVVKRIHTRLQSILCTWFENHAEAWGVVPSPELRTQVSATRVRLPDVVISSAGYASQVQVDPPWIAIEILSPGDSFADLSEKLRDYDRMGIPNIWVIDPENRRGWVSTAAGLAEASRFTVAGSPLYLELEAVFARFDRFR